MGAFPVSCLQGGRQELERRCQLRREKFPAHVLTTVGKILIGTFKSEIDF